MSNTPPCPTCGAPVHDEDDEVVWVFQLKFYCSEVCCREAARRA